LEEVKGTRMLRRIAVYSFDVGDEEAELIAHNVAHLVHDIIADREITLQPEMELTDEKAWVTTTDLKPLEEFQPEIRDTPSSLEVKIPGKALKRRFVGEAPAWLS
jgi:hypothetical protein